MFKERLGMRKALGVTQIQTLLIMGIVFLVLFFSIAGPFYTSFQKKRVAMDLSVLYSRFLNASRNHMIISGSDGVMDLNMELSEFVNTYFYPYFDVDKICDGIDQSGCWGNPQYTDLSTKKAMNRVTYSLLLSGGEVLGFVKGNDNRISILASLEGNPKKIKLGRDVFAFYVYSNDFLVKTCEDSAYTRVGIRNGVHIGGYDKCGLPHDILTYKELVSTELLDGCNVSSPESETGAGVGAACSALIHYNNWAIDKKYPW